MSRLLVATALVLACAVFSAFGQSAPSNPTMTYGMVPTVAQWNNWFEQKQDTLGYVPLNRAGDVMTGKLSTSPSSAASAGFNLAPGTTPASPVNGDIWTTGDGLYVQIGGNTIGPIRNGNVAGPSTSVVGDIAIFSTTDGSGIQDSGKSLPTGAIVGTTDAQTLTNKSIDASEINSGSLSLSVFPQISSNTVLGNATGASAVPSALSTTQLTTLCNTFTSSLSGCVPASGGTSTDVLYGNGTWGALPSTYPTISPSGGNDTTPIQALLNANAGGTVHFSHGAYSLSSDVTMPSPPVNFLMDAGVTFSGAGHMPATVTNASEYLTNSYLYYAPTGGAVNKGDNTLSVEVVPDTGYVGNAVAGYFGATTPDSGAFSGFLWGLNTLTRFQAGTTFSGNGIGYEDDMDNYNKDGIGVGEVITGVGTHTLQAGLSIERANSTSDWENGIQITHFQTGIEINGSTSTSANYGMEFLGIARNDIHFQPLDDTHNSDAQIYGTNAANSVVNWEITNGGGAVFTSFQMPLNTGTASTYACFTSSGQLISSATAC